MPGKEQFMTELKMKEMQLIRNEKESLQGMQIPCKRRNRISVSDHV